MEFFCRHGIPVIFIFMCLCLVTYFPHLQQKAPGLPLGLGPQGPTKLKLLEVAGGYTMKGGPIDTGHRIMYL